MKIISQLISESLLNSLARNEEFPAFYWLGQAGFAFKIENSTFLIDPYLSDSLAEKYKGSIFHHTRMMKLPVEPDKLLNVNWVICTHRHTDHMDPVTLLKIHKANPFCNFIIPRAWLQRVREYGIPFELIQPIDTDVNILLDNSKKIIAIPAAHEEIEKDAANNHLFLGYILKTNTATIYHSGDCIPYPGLDEKLGDLNIDIAFLPVNGRDYFRKQRGVPGNFTIDEAIEICIKADIPHLVCHHFGMFSFNTIEKEILFEKSEEYAHKLNIIIPEINQQYQIEIHDYSEA